MENNPNVQFIDYTKITNRLLQKLPKNYSLTYSQAENNLDNIVGFFHVKDFIKINKNEFDLNLILRDVLYTAPSSISPTISSTKSSIVTNPSTVPRAEIISIDNKQNYNQIFNIIKEESHSRLPVYENNLDNTIGDKLSTVK